MRIVDPLLTELENEAKISRRVLDRVPEDKLAWKPHPKSRSLGELAWHLAIVPSEIASVASNDVYELGSSTPPPAPATKSEIIEGFNRCLAEGKAYLNQLDDSRTMATWKLTKQGKELMAVPRIGFLRAIMLNHSYHHRGQLSVYLRLLDVPVPSIYGPSADENPFA
jgi:uncharacterized damage-inducible protein DinB